MLFLSVLEYVNTSISWDQAKYLFCSLGFQLFNGIYTDIEMFQTL